MNTLEVLAEVSKERRYQDRKWGGPIADDGHTPGEWLGFIREYWRAERGANYRDRLLKIAALAVAAIEAFDRELEKERGK